MSESKWGWRKGPVVPHQTKVWARDSHGDVYIHSSAHVAGWPLCWAPVATPDEVVALERERDEISELWRATLDDLTAAQAERDAALARAEAAEASVAKWMEAAADLGEKIADRCAEVERLRGVADAARSLCNGPWLNKDMADAIGVLAAAVSALTEAP